MSVAAVKWVYEAAPEHGAIARAVALCLAWHHTDDGSFPERQTIVRETGLSDGSVGKGLRVLQAEGTIERAGARPGGGTIVWRFPALDGPAPHAEPPEPEEGAAVQHDTPVQHDAPDRPVQRDALGGPAPRADDRSLIANSNGQGSDDAEGPALRSNGRTDVAREPSRPIESLF